MKSKYRVTFYLSSQNKPQRFCVQYLLLEKAPTTLKEFQQLEIRLASGIGDAVVHSVQRLDNE